MSQIPDSSWCPTPPEPSPSQDRRQLVGCLKSSLAHMGWSPLLLTGLLRQLLIQHYARPENIVDPDLRMAVWQESPATGILIESIHRWRPDAPDKRPAILLKRNAYRTYKIAINDRYGADEQGFEHFTALRVGSHTLFCTHETGASCEILATETELELSQFAPVIRQQLDFMKFEVIEVGSISEVEESTQNYTVPITVAWAYRLAWKIRPDALPLQGIDLEMLAHDC